MNYYKETLFGGIVRITREEANELFASDGKRRVRYTELEDGVRISTVFLVMDHGFGEGPPVLYETMIFGGPHHEYQERYHTRSEALEGHARAVTLAQS